MQKCEFKIFELQQIILNKLESILAIINAWVDHIVQFPYYECIHTENKHYIKYSVYPIVV